MPTYGQQFRLGRSANVCLDHCPQSSNQSQVPCLLRQLVQWRLLCLRILSKALEKVVLIVNVIYKVYTVVALVSIVD